RTNQTPAFFLRPGSGFLWACAVSQNNCVHIAGRIVLGSVVAEKTDQSAENFSDSPVSPHGHRHGFTGGLVGTLPSGYKPGSLSVPEPSRADSRRQSGCLVLSEQTDLAVESDFYLSQMDRLPGAPTRLHLVAGGSRIMRGDLLRETLRGSGRRSRGRFFRHHAKPGAWAYHAFHVSLHVCGGPLSVSGVYRTDRLGLRRHGHFRRCIQAQSRFDSERGSLRACRVRRPDVAAKRDVWRYRGALASHAGKKPGMLDGSH